VRRGIRNRLPGAAQRPPRHGSKVASRSKTSIAIRSSFKDCLGSAIACSTTYRRKRWSRAERRNPALAQMESSERAISGGVAIDLSAWLALIRGNRGRMFYPSAYLGDRKVTFGGAIRLAGLPFRRSGRSRWFVGHGELWLLENFEPKQQAAR
jgi:hypothetical protein